LKVNTSLLVQNKKSNNTHYGNQRPNYGQPAIGSAMDGGRVGPVGGNWHTTEINSKISRKEGPVKLNNPLLIAGFPGPGLIGSISTSFIIESLRMRQIACVESEFIMPGVIYVGGKLRHPFRLYANNEGTICVLVCETPILVQGIHRVLDAVMKWALDSNVTNVLVLEGMPMQGIPQSKRNPSILSNTEEDHTLINKLDAFEGSLMQSSKKRQEQIGNEIVSKHNDTSDNLGPTYIGGISGGLLSSCISNNIPCSAVLVPSLSGIPDPEGAAIILETLAELTSYSELRINVAKLRQQGNQVKKNLEKIARSIRNQQKSMNENERGQNEENLMYG
jgi:uncharacterized protein